jgi:hypothetical protein
VEEHDLFIRRFTGDVSLEDVLRSLREQLGLSGRPERLRGIEDVRRMSTMSWNGYDLDTLKRFRILVHEFMRLHPRVRAAVLVRETVQIGLTRQFSMLAEHAGLEVRPFTDLAQAKIFLDLPADLTLPLVE